MAKSSKGLKITNDKPQAGGETPVSVPAAAVSGKWARGFRVGGMTADASCFVAVALFAAFAAWLLVGRNSDLLYQAQNLSFFNSTSVFFAQCMSSPGGLLTWASSWLTQLFYYPALGASVMIALWVLTYYVTKRALRVSSLWAGVLLVPLLALLDSVVDNEYWIYYMKQQGFWFMATVGFLVSMLLTWGATAVWAVHHRMPVPQMMVRCMALVAIAATYPLFGYYSLLALIYSTVLICTRSSYSSPVVPVALALLLLVATPLTAYQFYTNTRMIDLWIAGYTLYVADECVSMSPQIPFITLALSPLLLIALPKFTAVSENKAVAVAAVNVMVALGGACIAEMADYQDHNYHAEMRMYRAMENQEWDKVLDEMGALPGDANRQMVMFKNISLLNKGQLGTKMFTYNNMANNPKNDYDTLHIHMVQTAAPMIYYHHGKTNFAIRWCIENGVEYGPKFNDMKLLALCSIVNGEWDAARKYLTILSHTMFWSDWAEHYMPLVDNPELITQYHEFDNVRELYTHMGTVLDGDQGLCEMYLLNYFSNTMNKDSKLLQELTLNYALVQKDIQLFWPRFFLYATLHQGEEMPVHYQEAAFLYGNLERQVDISKMPFDKDKVVNRYYSFQQMSQSFLQNGMTTKELAEVMKPAFGDTFYWFYFFCRDLNSY